MLRGVIVTVALALGGCSGGDDAPKHAATPPITGSDAGDAASPETDAASPPGPDAAPATDAASPDAGADVDAADPNAPTWSITNPPNAPAWTAGDPAALFPYVYAVRYGDTGNDLDVVFSSVPEGEVGKAIVLTYTVPSHSFSGAEYRSEARCNQAKGLIEVASPEDTASALSMTIAPVKVGGSILAVPFTKAGSVRVSFKNIAVIDRAAHGCTL